MNFTPETLAQISTRVRGYFTQAIQGAIASVWPNSFTVSGKVLAMLDFERQQRRKWLYDQIFASTASAPSLYRHGWELGLGGPAPATPATGTATVSCTPGLGIPAGIQFQRADGATFSVRALVTPSGSVATLPLQADAAGAAGNSEAGTSLSLVPSTAAPAGLGDTATVVTQDDGGGFEGGADAETDEHYRAKVLARKRQPPMGGAAPDYQEWAQEALPTVTGVFVDTFIQSTRRVWVAFLVSDQANGIPSDGEVATVQAYLSDPVRRPVTATVSVVAPSPQAVDITFSSLTPNTAAAQAAVLAELEAIFAENVSPATPSTSFTLYREWLDAAIDRAPGVTAGTVSIPSGNLVYSTGGQMPVLGTVTWPS